MNNKVVANIVRFVVFLLLQVFVCNYVHLFGFLNPSLYVFALLMLPLNIPSSLQYVIAFATGFVVDVFSMSYGIYAAASLLLIFIRPYMLKWLAVGKMKDKELEIPVPGQKTFIWLATYTFSMTLVHQFAVTMLETFSFHRFYLTLGIVILNAIFTTLLILAIQYILVPLKKK